jgi:glycosyltransferase involved in cell wall biosynthesis
MFAENYYPEIGGGATYAKEFVKRFAQYGIKTTVLTKAWKTKIVNEYDTIRIGEYFISSGGKLGLKRLKFAFNTIKTLMKLKNEYNLVHYHSGFVAETVGYIMKLLKYPLPQVLTLHGVFLEDWEKINKFYGVAVPVIKKIQFSRISFDHYFAVDDGTGAYNFLRDCGIPKRLITKHYHCVDCNLFKPRKKTSKTRRVVYVGRLDPFKGINEFIEAMPLILKENPDIKFDLIGGGSQYEIFHKKVSELGILKSVKFHGSIKHEMLPEMLKNANVAVYPDIRGYTNPDYLNLTMCETMAMGIPIVSSSTPRKEWKLKTWLKIQEKGSKDLAENVNRLLSDEKLAKNLAKNARKIAEKFFDWNKTIKKYIDVYERLVDKKACTK